MTTINLNDAASAAIEMIAESAMSGPLTVDGMTLINEQVELVHDLHTERIKELRYDMLLVEITGGNADALADLRDQVALADLTRDMVVDTHDELVHGVLEAV